MSDLLRALVRELIMESRIREADISGGRKTEFGSDEHVADLEGRLREAESWRDKQRRGSSARADYSRIVDRLRSELSSARRSASKKSEPLAEIDDYDGFPPVEKKMQSKHDCTKCYKPIASGTEMETKSGLLYHAQCAPKHAKKAK